MSLPNAASAFVEPIKVRDYLLSPSHPIGRFKATVFVALGYSAAQWEILRDDLLGLAQTGTAISGQASGFGKKFEVDGILTGPFGRSAYFKTVWMLRTGEAFPRFVTAFPR